jgi:hypothetical protein
MALFFRFCAAAWLLAAGLIFLSEPGIWEVRVLSEARAGFGWLFAAVVIFGPPLVLFLLGRAVGKSKRKSQE